ncbi:MAG: macro domain-containing protein [Rhodospirillales bacterium]
MIRRKIHSVSIECALGNIADQRGIAAVVNAANAELLPGSGVAGALHDVAGPELKDECKPLAPISPGQAVITGAGTLANGYVIHCLGPVYGRDRPADSLLASCYRNALHLAEQNAIDSIAFPAISTGAFGYPLEPAARIAITTVLDEAERLISVKLIRFVLFDYTSLNVFVAALDDLSSSVLAFE